MVYGSVDQLVDMMVEQLVETLVGLMVGGKAVRLDVPMAEN